MNDELATALTLFWEEGPPAFSNQGTATVRALEAKYDIRLPEDFKAYLIEACPAEEYWRGRGVTLWPPEQIKSLLDECGPETSPDRVNPEIEAEANRYLVFADFMCWCYAYAICCSEGPNRGRIAIIDGSGDHLIANSFREFIELAAANASDLHPPAQNSVANLPGA